MAGVPINRLLKDGSLEPDQVRRLNLAFDKALRTLHLVDRNDPITEMIARTIIKIGERTGLSDPVQISELALKELSVGGPT